MDWIRDNKFLTGWLVLTALGVGVLVVMLLGARGKYEDAYGQFDTTRGQVLALESKAPYPSPENAGKKEGEIGSYADAVHSLQAELNKFQRPLRPVEQTAFQADLKNRIQLLARDAKRAGVALPEGFAFGMGRYVNTLPPPELCPLLDYQLDALSALATSLVKNGVVGIDSFEREPLPGEPGGRMKEEAAPAKGKRGAAGPPPPPLERYPVEIVFRSKPDPFREFVNGLSNPSQEEGGPYHILRLLRVANQKQLGPPRSEGGGGSGFSADDDFGSSVPEEISEGAPEGSLEEGSGEVDGIEEALPEDFDLVETGDGAPSSTGAIDSEFVLGQELVEVYAKIELVRFKQPAKENLAGEKAGESNKKQP